MLRRYCFEKFCISGELEIPACRFSSWADGSILKICLFKQEIKINMTFGEQLSRRTFRSQNKYFTCVKIPQASSFLRRRISNLPELRSPNTISEYHKADTLVCVLSTTFLRSVQRRGIYRGIYLPSTAINFLIKLRASERCGRIFRSEAARWEIDFCRRVGRAFFRQARCVTGFIVTYGCCRRRAAFFPLACFPRDKIHPRSLIATKTTIKRSTSGLDVAEFSSGLLA